MSSLNYESKTYTPTDNNQNAKEDHEDSVRLLAYTPKGKETGRNGISHGGKVSEAWKKTNNFDLGTRLLKLIILY